MLNNRKLELPEDIVNYIKTNAKIPLSRIYEMCFFFSYGNLIAKHEVLSSSHLKFARNVIGTSTPLLLPAA